MLLAVLLSQRTNRVDSEHMCTIGSSNAAYPSMSSSLGHSTRLTNFLIAALTPDSWAVLEIFAIFWHPGPRGSA